MEQHCVSRVSVTLSLLLVLSLGACNESNQQEIQNRASEVTNRVVNKGGEEAKKLAGDAAVTASVKAKIIEDATARATAISVSTDNGVVTLSGKVESQEAKANAEAVAKNIDGVTSVVNNLTVEAPALPATKGNGGR